MEPWTIFIPTRPQPDTIVAIFILTTLGRERFPGIEDARIEVKPSAPAESFEALIAQKILPLDVGGGPFDHHATGACASELVADYLGIRDNPALGKLLAYAKRDDAFGKGTSSNDPIDRAFGLSGLIASLNKTHPGEADKIVHFVLPLLAAHYQSAYEHHVESPRVVEEKKKTGEYEELAAEQSGKKLKVAFVVSDKPSMPTYLRSMQGPRADVVVQKAESSGRVSILTRQERKVRLAAVAALLRMREAELRSISLPEDSAYWAKDGRADELPMWYVDPATNSILNVGETRDDDTKIPWEEFKRLVPQGLSLVTKRPRA